MQQTNELDHCFIVDIVHITPVQIASGDTTAHQQLSVVQSPVVQSPVSPSCWYTV